MRSVWVGVATGLMLAAVTHAATDTGKPVAAVWKEQQLNFHYMGRTSRYSCVGLRDKVRAMLLDLGARPDPRITAVGCEDAPRAGLPHAGFGSPSPSPSPSLSIVFASPALPNAALKPQHPGDLKAVDARFEAFTLTSDAFRNMGIGDCELVEEFARQVLPKLVTRNLQQDITCVPYQQSGSRFLVRGEILRALPKGITP